MLLLWWLYGWLDMFQRWLFLCICRASCAVGASLHFPMGKQHWCHKNWLGWLGWRLVGWACWVLARLAGLAGLGPGSAGPVRLGWRSWRPGRPACRLGWQSCLLGWLGLAGGRLGWLGWRLGRPGRALHGNSCVTLASGLDTWGLWQRTTPRNGLSLLLSALTFL